ncbi:MAG: SpoIIE family protein phosphatase [Candidatus Contendobacter sp.]|nr:SpoIIE family protein phosphatase [Candidatus Contendobacter sp.]
MSFRLKTILGVAAIEAVLLALLVWSGLLFIERSAEQEFTQRVQATVQAFAITAKGAVIASDLASLQSFVRETLTYPGVIYARVRDVENRVLASAGDREVLERPFVADADFGAIADGVFDTAGTIAEAGVPFGRVELGLSARTLREIKMQAWRYGIGLALLEMGLVALFSLALGMYLTRQLKNLTEGARRVAAGELGYQVPVRGQDELAETAHAFNVMSARVRQSHTVLAGQEERLRRVLNSTHDAIIVTDDAGIIESFNAGAEAMFGYRADDIIGRNVSMLAAPPHREQHDDYMRRYRETGRAHILGVERQFEARRQDGGVFPMALRVNEINEAGRRRFLGVIHDITEHKRAENALRETKEAAEEAATATTQILDEMIYDLELAATMQKALLPPPLRVPGATLEWIFQPSHFIGGDIFDYFMLGERHLSFYQLDVTGHGVPAALLSFTLSQVLAQGAEEQRVRRQMAGLGEAAVPPLVVADINQRFQSSIDPPRYFTMIYGNLDLYSGRVILTQAGHPRPIWLHRADRRAELVGTGGFPVGLFPDVEYDAIIFNLACGDRLFLYSDGVTECANAAGEPFSEPRLLRLIEDTIELPAVAVAEQVDQALRNWRGDEDLREWMGEGYHQDDITLLILEREPQP